MEKEGDKMAKLSGKLLLLITAVVTLSGLLIGVYLQSRPPETIVENGEPNVTTGTIVENEIPTVTSAETNSAHPLFSLKDLQDVNYNLTDFEGSIVVLHFMATGCGGQYSEINDNQLKQLKLLCTSLCNVTHIKIFTILVTTCTDTDLQKIHDFYNVTWVFGNDYQDNKLDIVEAYSDYLLEDGSIVLLNTDLSVNEAIHGRVSAKSLEEKIAQISEG